MDVGNPSNFARIMDLYDNSHKNIRNAMSAYAFSDNDLKRTMGEVYQRTGYMLDPHGAAGYQALIQHTTKDKGIPGVFFETAHPGKFSLTVEEVIQSSIEIPDMLKQASTKEKQSIPLSAEFTVFKDFLIQSSV